MTIVEFLLARIAADEAVAQAINLPALGGWETEEGWDDASGGTGRVESSVTRALAECAAKREIVDLYGSLCFGNGDRAGDDVLGALALPYADHPDCPSWVRP